MAESNFFEYKGKPLVRSGDTIYYGDMAEPYVVMLQIKSTKQVNGEEVADKVSVQLMSTDPNTPPMDIVKKHTEKEGIYEAIDIASIWLGRALAE